MFYKIRAPLFEVSQSGIHGRGAFALNRIRKGTRIIEYTGERISSGEGDRRYRVDGQSHYHTFLFTVDEDICIDAGRHGNAARFINHSCRPNCQAVNDGGRIFIEAIRTLQPGDELTYDYNMVGVTPRTRAEKALYVCMCGAASCRGTMLQQARSRFHTSRKRS